MKARERLDAIVKLDDPTTRHIVVAAMIAHAEAVKEEAMKRVHRFRKLKELSGTIADLLLDIEDAIHAIKVT